MSRRVLVSIVIGCMVLLALSRLVPQRTSMHLTHASVLATPRPVVSPPAQVVTHGSRQRHEIALTFDADMTPEMLYRLEQHQVASWYNAPIKETLDREHAKATIFFTGLWAQTYPNETKALAHDPLIEVENHSYSHPAFATPCYGLSPINDVMDNEEITKTQTILHDTTGATPRYFRFPGGCYDTVDLQAVQRAGLTVVHWDVVSGDPFNTNVPGMVKHILGTVQNGSIIVMHLHGGPNAPKTNDVLEKIIPVLKQRGYSFVTVAELLR